MLFNLKYAVILNWIAALILLTIGLLNLFLVHPVPGIAFIIFSLIYFPPVTELLKKNLNLIIPPIVKVFLFVFLVWFTLGISDLGDLFDKQFA
jgi:uncharacterized membrane protein